MKEIKPPINRDFIRYNIKKAVLKIIKELEETGCLSYSSTHHYISDCVAKILNKQ